MVADGTAGLIVFLIAATLAAVAIGAWTFARMRSRGAKGGRRW